MSKSRRIWFLGPVLVLLVMLLAMSRGGRPATPAPPADPGASAASARVDEQVGAAGAGEQAAAEAGLQVDGPRHPEIGFRGKDRLLEHFRKHGREFHVKSAEQYLRLAQTLRDRPKGGDILEFVRNDAVTCKFDRATGAFVAYNSDGSLRTFFRPNDGEAYFERQKSRAHEAP